MCGIIGYIGRRPAYPLLLEGLQKVEYRGYDSAGIALLDDQLNVYKKAGKVKTLATYIQDKHPVGQIGIGHTRWATHGIPNDQNAHPHVSVSGQLAIVHNGIIENEEALRRELIQQGYTFRSDTDTEVLVNWIENIQRTHGYPLDKALRWALTQVVGAYALVVMSADQPDTLIAARKSSPLMVGVGQDEFFIASDCAPIIQHTDRVVYMDDHEIAIVKVGSLSMRNMEDIPLLPRVQKVDMDVEAIEKGGFAHFMLKEIFEQPKALVDCMRGRIDKTDRDIKLGGILEHLDTFSHAPSMTLVACGSSWCAGLVAKYFLEGFCRIPTTVEYASEFRYRNPIIQAGDIVWAISQSGETADTLAAIQLAQEHDAQVFSICNVAGSSIARAARAGIYTHAGAEIGVASTKTFTTQVAVLVMLALKLGRRRGTLSRTRFSELLAELTDLPAKIQAILRQADQFQYLAQVCKAAKHFLYLGRGYNYPIALEGALKLKELSYVHAEGYPAGEMKHGAMALIDQDMPVLCMATQDETYAKTISNMQEVKARKGRIVALVTEGDVQAARLADYVIKVPATYPALMPIVSVVPLQLFAYYMAVARGCDVDQPRNLAKSVTVE